MSLAPYLVTYGDFERISRRSLRPHPTCDLSDSWRTTQAKCQAERFNRLYVQGTRTLLTSSGLSESWWPSARAQCAGFRFYFQQRWLCFLRAMFWWRTWVQGVPGWDFGTLPTLSSQREVR